MVKIPNLPPKEELEYKEKEFLLSLNEQFQRSSKVWFIILGVMIILTIPLKILVEGKFTESFITSYRPPPVNENPYHPEEIKVLKVKALPVTAGAFSAYAHLLNPNPNLTAHEFIYQFIFQDAAGEILKEIMGKSFLSAGESRFLLMPLVNLNEEPAEVILKLAQVRWTSRSPKFEIQLDVLQKNTGITAEKKFFAEGILKNLQGFGLRKVDVEILVFDRAGQNILAVNSTVLTDIKPFEGRYFRVLWPQAFENMGQVQIIPIVNPLEPGLILEETENIPAR